MGDGEGMSTDPWPANLSTSNLVIWLQKLAKNISHCSPRARTKLLNEAATRLQAYRQAERQREHDPALTD